MANEQQAGRVAEILDRLGLTGEKLQNVKLGPGVVGRNSSIAWVFMVVMLAGVIASAIQHNNVLLGLSIAGAIVVAVLIAVGNIYFGSKNPAAALLEGAQFVEYHQLTQMAARGIGVIEAAAPPVTAPPSLPTRDVPQLGQEDQSQ